MVPSWIVKQTLKEKKAHWFYPDFDKLLIENPIGIRRFFFYLPRKAAPWDCWRQRDAKNKNQVAKNPNFHLI